jgi:hypothetical protein
MRFDLLGFMLVEFYLIRIFFTFLFLECLLAFLGIAFIDQNKISAFLVFGLSMPMLRLEPFSFDDCYLRYPFYS